VISTSLTTGAHSVEIYKRAEGEKGSSGMGNEGANDGADNLPAEKITIWLMALSPLEP
jgi:hypothetical protein